MSDQNEKPKGTLRVTRTAASTTARTPGPQRAPIRSSGTNSGGARRTPVAQSADLPAAHQPRTPTSRPSPALARKSTPATTPADGKVRISKLLSERGLCSRREADTYIERGLVFVDGVRVNELGTRVDPKSEITLDKLAHAQQENRVTILLHKPVGYVSGQAEDGHQPAVTLISADTQAKLPGATRFHPGHLKGIAPAGRLDIDSTGLLILTQDGRIAKQLIGENSDVEKEYLVRVAGDIAPDGLKLLNHGLSLDNVKLRPAKVTWQNKDQLRFILKEGKKRQIRRMCELVGLKVVGLKRVRIGNVMLGDLPMGQWRYLRPDEQF